MLKGITSKIQMSEKNVVANIFVASFVVIALAFMVIKSWLLFTQTVAQQKAQKKGTLPKEWVTLLYFLALALVVTALLVFMLWFIENYTDINLAKKSIKNAKFLFGMEG